MQKTRLGAHLGLKVSKTLPKLRKPVNRRFFDILWGFVGAITKKQDLYSICTDNYAQQAQNWLQLECCQTKQGVTQGTRECFF